MILKRGRDSPIRKAHHPWIYRQAVLSVIGEPSVAEPVAVRSEDGEPLGWGLWSAGSLIAVRMIGFSREKPPEEWVADRIRRAAGLRSLLAIDSNAFRLVNAEGDHVPGLVLDLYADTVVLTPHVRGIEAQADRIVACLRRLYPEKRIFLKRDEHHARTESLGLASGYLHGDGDGMSVITEGSIRLIVDCMRGQKTGFYLDQRENRRIAAQCCAGRRVLNLFSYTGAFALQAAAAGASKVVSVESSDRAVELCQANVRLNPQLPKDRFEWVRGDVFSFLENPGNWDVVIADPPPFARRRAELDGAIRGYLGLFGQCLKALSPGGMAFFFSCSAAVDRQTFRQVVAETALRSGRIVRFLRQLNADVDHPVSAAHPQGEYLKGWMIHAE